MTGAINSRDWDYWEFAEDYSNPEEYPLTSCG